MPRFLFETIHHDSNVFWVGIKQDSKETFLYELNINIRETPDKDYVLLRINSEEWRTIQERQTYLDEAERRLVEYAIEKAPNRLSKESSERAVALLKKMFSLERPFEDVAARIQELPTETQEIISKYAMLSKLRDDPMFYGRKKEEFLMPREARANPDYAMIAIKQNGKLLIEAPKNIRNNKDIVIAALKAKEGEYIEDEWKVFHTIYESISPTLMGDKDVVLQAIKRGVRIPWSYLDDEFQHEILNDKKLFLQVMPFLRFYFPYLNVDTLEINKDLKEDPQIKELLDGIRAQAEP